MHDVELWQKPINGDKHTLPVIKVGDKIFVYAKDGLHTYPADNMSRPPKWQKLGETTLDIDQVWAKAYEIFAKKFSEFDADKSNAAQYARALAAALVR